MRWALILFLVAAVFVVPEAAPCHAHGKPSADISRGPDVLDTGDGSLDPGDADISDTGSSSSAISDISAADISDVAAAGGSSDVGVAVLDLQTNQVVSEQGDKPFYSASLAKLILAFDALHQQLSAGDTDLIDRALSASDDNAMDVLWTRFDGMDAIGRVAAEAGLTGTHAPDDPSQWGEVVITANDMVRLYQHILGSPERDAIVGALSKAPATAADGFDQAFGLLGVTGAYAKQGWMYYLPSEVYLHSAGVLDDRYAVAVLTTNPTGSWTTARQSINAVTTAVLAKLGVNG
ncbi:class A beta-lactamase-related serine hydrolase [Lentzea sp. NBC_00516]|uniref:serine hydrolase n=1 Tax=Lentzea sp. NBC_00516 TaxID=2903582 RepID=UPI002E802BBA|nr:serine hydrolase [Lentzea sp. NBC_00516]WUD21081.1 class A beta-lactamase-related serine hydrolase [Lentzea sp. NBC_00516]